MSKDGTLAIDLGSTTTVVAFQASDGSPPQLLDLPPYSCGDPVVIPSLLWFSGPEDRYPLIGRQVLDAGTRPQESPLLCRDFKRRIGAPRDGEAGAATPLAPERVGGLLLERIWEQLPEQHQPRRLVLTAPIDSYRRYRQWLQEATAALPVEEIALVDEPTAAAIGAGLPPGSLVLVVDLGGGTIDLSLVALEGGEGKAAPIAQLLRFAGRRLDDSRQALRCARIIGKAGLALGGRDLDRWIAAALVPQAAPCASLLEAAEQLKCALSIAPQALVHWAPELGGPPRALQLERNALEALLRAHGLLVALDQLLETVLAAGRAQGLGLQQIDAVLPVGGSSRIPLIRQWLSERCPGVPLRDERPIEAVALGALALTPGVQVRDVLTRGVSLRCWDRRSFEHRWHPLFLAGQSWPTVRPMELVLACSRDGQAELELTLGEPRPDDRSEVVFIDGLPQLRHCPAGAVAVEPWAGPPLLLPLDPPGQQGVDRLRLLFSIDSAGQLRLERNDLSTGDHAPALVLGAVR
ncbi:Hsp70 family protein [Cyanobium sp. Morenito 9A2]|uniref:Hsp70 family protein n=1 Tax=Cyanobium sp. Morenito 9A2 TaxID=2823718 RepID=UPI0020CD8789|nr:Hsp70 family protein [Cyanobium sp. Morenito 9A2]MCP9849114.1 Hsp70 family protein [Cyanobium sp. Morenito 9A2]